MRKKLIAVIGDILPIGTLPSIAGVLTSIFSISEEMPPRNWIITRELTNRTNPETIIEKSLPALLNGFNVRIKKALLNIIKVMAVDGAIGIYSERIPASVYKFKSQPAMAAIPSAKATDMQTRDARLK